jgi:hypothetical protein
MKNNNKKWQIELTEEQLYLISRAIEFTSRFHCGQIGNTYLPYETQELLEIKNPDGKTVDWDATHMNRERFDALGGLMKNLLYPELHPMRYSSYGVNKHIYADNLYDIYKQINVAIKKENDSKLPPEEIIYNVNSSFTKFGNLPNINLKPIEDEPKKD